MRSIAGNNTLNSIVGKDDYWICTVSGHIEHKIEKELGVALADTIGNPSTVVIHAQNAPFTLWAMMGSGWLVTVTSVAISQILFV